MNLPKRKATRIKGYDYSTPGAYFVTICTHNKQHILGNIVGGGVLDAPKMILSEYGEIAEKEILKIASYYNNVVIDKYVIMPNHIHIIIMISETEGINPFPTKNVIFQMLPESLKRE